MTVSWRASRLALVSGLTAGVLYNSWAVGYWLNPAVAQHGLASELEALHQPFNWLFILCDVICGGLVTLLAVWLWRSHQPLVHRRALFGYGAFGLLTIADSLLPMQCDPSIQRCPDVFHQPILIAHGVCSIAASFGLFAGVAILWWARRKNVGLQLLIIGYVLFGIFSIISLLTPGQDSWSQHYALLLDGICIAVIPLQLITQTADRGH